MTIGLLVGFVLAYFLVLIGISQLTKGKNNKDFYLAGRKSPWYLVAFGMIGASLSGITFVSVPGWTADLQFTYLEIVAGNFIGYLIVAFVLLPIYYRMNLTSIYSFLENRFGFWSYKTGAFFFLISRILGAAMRMLLVSIVLESILYQMGYKVPFAAIATIAMALIYIYTFRGGIGTIVYTDTLQTLFMLLALGSTVYLVLDNLDFSFVQSLDALEENNLSGLNEFDWKHKHHMIKHIIGGMFITIGMTGLDQDMMQKNLSCRNLKSAQKNMLTFSVVLIVVNFLFIYLGGLLYLFSDKTNLTENLPNASMLKDTDLLFSSVAISDSMPMVVGVLFLLGLLAAAYSSADSALTSLTTSFCIDFMDQKEDKDEDQKQRKKVHILMTIVLLAVILVFKEFKSRAIIDELFNIASFTYGPLIGLFFFGIISKKQIDDIKAPIICIVAPILCYLLQRYSPQFLWGYNFGFELLLVNGLITFVGLLLISKKQQTKEMKA